MTLGRFHTVQCWAARKGKEVYSDRVDHRPRYTLKGKSKLQSQTSEKFIYLYFFVGGVGQREANPYLHASQALRKNSEGQI